MSHFVVAVVTKTPTELEAILQPFHEFECTGVEDQYVEIIDETEKALEDFAKATETRLRDPEGNLHDLFDDKGNWKPEFSQPDKDTIFPDTNRRVEFIPDGYTRVEVPASSIQSAAEWISDYYGRPIKTLNTPKEEIKFGWIELNKDGSVAKCINRTNPNKRWDWWTVGGRWKGSFLTKRGRKVDQARKADIDFATMRADAEAKAAAEYDAAIKVIDGRPIPQWDKFREELFPGTIEAARKAFQDDPVMTEWKKAYPDHFFGPNPEDYDMPREAFIEAAGDNSFGAFAVLDENGWHEKGSMGWWGVTHNEQDDVAWGKQLQAFLGSVPEDYFISMVDCHI